VITPGEARAPLTQEAQVQPVGSPTAILIVNDTPVTVTIDTGAQITVLRRGLLPGPPALPSKYRLRGVNDAVSVLYGPVITTLKIAGEEYRCVALESDIHDECILGMDFMRVHRAVVDTGRLKLYLDSPSKNAQVTCQFALRESSDAGKFGANSVFVVARAAVTVELQPYSSVICPAQLRGIFPVEDRLVTARVLRAQCVLESDGSMEATMDGVHTVPMVPVTSCVVSPDGTRGSSSEEVTGGAALLGPEAVRPRRGSADKSDFDTTPKLISLHTVDVNVQSRGSICPNGAYEREVDRALYALTMGLVQPSPLLDQRQCSLVPGVVPFAQGTMELELENQSVNHVVLPRGSVVALVHPVGFVDLQKYEPLDPDDTVDVESATVERVPPTDQADIQLKPRLPPIALDEALPEDLQALADRCEDLTLKQKREVADVLRRNHDIFVKNNDDFGCCPWVKFKIDTGDHPPIKMQARPIPIHLREEVASMYRKYLEQGTCRPSQSPWAFPILVILKKTLDKNGKPELRCCVDYRALNKITRIPASPIPRTQELLERLAGRRWYSHADLASGYHNLEIAEEDIPKTAITLPDSLGLPSRFLEYTRMPFGLSAAPGVFQGVTDRLIRPSLQPTPDCDLGTANGVYLDDICVADDAFVTMLQKIQALFNRIRASGFLLKAKKCFLFKRKLKFLGFCLNEKGIGADEAKVNKIVHWPTPRNVSELWSWIGLVGFYSRFIHRLAEIQAPLTDLLCEKVPFVWSDECQHAFDSLKTALTTAPVLGAADPSKGVFSLHCDASARAVACILSQEQDGRPVVLHYHSK